MVTYPSKAIMTPIRCHMGPMVPITAFKSLSSGKDSVVGARDQLGRGGLRGSGAEEEHSNENGGTTDEHDGC